MRKSDFLDEMRLEVGLAYDYARSQDDFIARILKTIFAISRKKAMLTLHKYCGSSNELVYALGIKGMTKEQEMLGQGFVSPSKMRAVTYIKKDRQHVLFLPIYHEDQLEHMVTIRLLDSDYRMSKQDMIFAQELITFIESKRSTLL
ncbi:hypothetical protein FLK61_33315 [Paenalkalicoccus suaedae]|uniref:GAF domain-containing protein n=1 Tax=Paenalkalicoccus suaedae TaxID=2592382 RepID=A0A859FF33_9BACI|nr:hypothetical protein [Paenalkalicoccus suaedae]QKS71571.1 hypothetical protein FLK61_33315 [Paenalkalicoccus suaedae]